MLFIYFFFNIFMKTYGALGLLKNLTNLNIPKTFSFEPDQSTIFSYLFFSYFLHLW